MSASRVVVRFGNLGGGGGGDRPRRDEVAKCCRKQLHNGGDVSGIALCGPSVLLRRGFTFETRAEVLWSGFVAKMYVLSMKHSRQMRVKCDAHFLPKFLRWNTKRVISLTCIILLLPFQSILHMPFLNFPFDVSILSARASVHGSFRSISVNITSFFSLSKFWNYQFRWPAKRAIYPFKKEVLAKTWVSWCSMFHFLPCDWFQFEVRSVRNVHHLLLWVFCNFLVSNVFLPGARFQMDNIFSMCPIVFFISSCIRNSDQYMFLFSDKLQMFFLSCNWFLCHFWSDFDQFSQQKT